MLKWGGCTDVGRTRPLNEDGFYISAYSHEQNAMYALVADGMGGHQAGEVASAMAIREISEIINKQFCTSMTEQELLELLAKAVKSANRVIFEKALSESGCSGMGTTLTLCFIWGAKAYVAQVGDSRLYLYRGESLHRITTDHSLVQELLDKGQITEAEAACHPQKNVITRALGTDSGVEIDLYDFTLRMDDILLLCTDGLSNMLSDEMLAFELSRGSLIGPENLAAQLVAEANSQGGYDNITTVLLQVC